MNWYKKMGLKVFRWAYKLPGQKGRDRLARLTLFRRLYFFLWSWLGPSLNIVLADSPGGRMWVDVSKYGAGWTLFLGGHYDEYETILFKKIVKEAMTVVDLGAHVGHYTLLAAKHVGENGKVFAFEPDPSNFALLERNVKENGYPNVVLVRKAVSNYNGTTKLFRSQKDTVAHSLYDFHDGNAITVEVTTLDIFFQNQPYPIDVVKMDIEGAEMEALEGMTEIILRNNNLKLLVELSPKIIEERGLSLVSYLNKIIEYGFKVYAITSREPWIKPISSAEIIVTYTHGKGSINLFCQK